MRIIISLSPLYNQKSNVHVFVTHLQRDISLVLPTLFKRVCTPQVNQTIRFPLIDTFETKCYPGGAMEIGSHTSRGSMVSNDNRVSGNPKPARHLIFLLDEIEYNVTIW